MTETHLQRLTSKSGLPTIQVDGVAYHSAHNPQREAQRFYSSFQLEQADVILHFGWGLGYCGDILRTRIKRTARVIVFEPDADLFALYGTEPGDQQIACDERIQFVVGDQVRHFFDEWPFGNCQETDQFLWIEWPPAVSGHRALAESLLLQLRSCIQNRSANLLAQAERLAQLYGVIAKQWKTGENPFPEHSIINADRMGVLQTALSQVLAAGIRGEVWECGVYKGGSAKVIAETLGRGVFDSGVRIDPKMLRLFDSFDGMRETSDFDLCRVGDFADTRLSDVVALLNQVCDRYTIAPGWIPETFNGLEESLIAFAHIDVDLYQSYKDCIEFIWPRLSPGGCMLFDDYGFGSCPGAKKACDEAFGDRLIKLPTLQAVIWKEESDGESHLGSILSALE